VTDKVIDNPIVNRPHDEPSRHFTFDDEGITDRIENSRRPPSYWIVPVFHQFEPVGPTTEINFVTVKDVMATSIERCHVNFVTLDGGNNTWERTVAMALDSEAQTGEGAIVGATRRAAVSLKLRVVVQGCCPCQVSNIPEPVHDK
jgi:hypothetical protein